MIKADYSRIHELNMRKANVKSAGDLLITAIVMAETEFLDDDSIVAELKMYRSQVAKARDAIMKKIDALTHSEWERIV